LAAREAAERRARQPGKKLVIVAVETDDNRRPRRIKLRGFKRAHA